MNNDLFHQLALTMIPNVGPVQAKILLQHCEAEEIFHAKKSWLEKLEGIGPVRAEAIKSFKDFQEVEKELRFIEKNNIRPLFLTDPAYPKRLLNCYDSPILLFYKGEADLNADKIVAIVGTRNHTNYARNITEQLIRDLAEHHVLISSGLAFGVDAIAHKACIKNDVPTVGVLAHGLDQIYPPDNYALSKEILHEHGGLLTEFRSGSKPDKHNFPARNRIVAGMSDAIIVIETGLKGGSMITAELGNGYNKDVFAIPGKLTDSKSAGCNELIKKNRAELLTDAEQLVTAMSWAPKKKEKKVQRELFIELTPAEKQIVSILAENDMHIDEINFRSGLSSGSVAAAILNLELQNVVVSLPGKIFRLT